MSATSPKGKFRSTSSPTGKATCSVKVGDDVDVYFDSSESESGGIQLSRQRAENLKVWDEIEKAFNEGQGVEGLIVGKVKGGFKVDIGVAGISAGLPCRYSAQPQPRPLHRHHGPLRDSQIQPHARQCRGVAARALGEGTRRAQAGDSQSSRRGRDPRRHQSRTSPATAPSSISAASTASCISAICPGDGSAILRRSSRSARTVKVVVLKFDTEKERISLGMKQLTPDPWQTVAEKYRIGARVQGKVISIMDYGAFVELESGIEGLDSYLRDVVDAQSHPSVEASCRSDQQVEVVVLNVDPGHRRISLGLKQVMANPWEAAQGKISGRHRGQRPGAQHHRLRHLRRHRGRHRRSGAYLGSALDQEGQTSLRALQEGRHRRGQSAWASMSKTSASRSASSRSLPIPGKPWPTTIRSGSKLKGQVTSVPDFGVFVRIEEGVEGLDPCLAAEHRAGRQAVELVQSRRRGRSRSRQHRSQRTQDRSQRPGAAPHRRAPGNGELS